MIFDVKNFPVFSFIKDGDIVNNGDILYNADKEWLTELSGYRPDKYLTNILRNNLTFIKKTMADASKNIFYVSSDLMKEMQSEIEGYNTLFDSDYKKISQYCTYNRSKCMPMPCILIWHDNKQHQHVNILNVTDNKIFAVYMYCGKIVSVQISKVYESGTDEKIFKTDSIEFKNVPKSAMPLMVIANMIKLNNKFLWQWKVEIKPWQSLRLTGHLMPFVNKTPYTINFI